MRRSKDEMRREMYNTQTKSVSFPRLGNVTDKLQLLSREREGPTEL